MSNSFAITAATNDVSLDNNQKGQAVFTVSNTTAKALHSRAHMVSQPETTAWLALQGEAERDIAASGSQQYSVLITVPPGTKAGDYTFHLTVANQANPDDDFSDGPTVKFSVAAPPAPAPKPFPWWIVAVAAGVIIIVGGSIYGFARLLHPAPPPPPPPVYCLHASTQSLMVTGIDAETDSLTQTVTLNNCGSAGKWTSTIKTASGGAWLSLITPSSSTLGAGAKQDISIVATNTPTGSAPLTIGNYTGTILFTLGGHSIPVAVTFNIIPTLSVDQTILNINANGGVRISNILLTNNGHAGTISSVIYTDTNRNWLRITPTNVTIGEGGKQIISIYATDPYAGFFGVTFADVGHITFTIQTSAGTASVTVTVNFRNR